MATYNGEIFIRQQLDSIRYQLSDHDEMVISDDSSNDKTLEIIDELNDPRIKLVANNKFRNPIYNFEFCLSIANGDILFLSDQDDIWLPSKVQKIITVFRENPEITLVASDACIINSIDEVTQGTFYNKSFFFNSGVVQNIIRNRFLGCTLAFRRKMLGVLLPFPRQLPMHDSWIGIMNQLFGKVFYIDEPLIAYRRHNSNYSSSTHLSIAHMITFRWYLAKAVALRGISCCFRKMAKIDPNLYT